MTLISSFRSGISPEHFGKISAEVLKSLFGPSRMNNGQHRGCSYGSSKKIRNSGFKKKPMRANAERANPQASGWESIQPTKLPFEKSGLGQSQDSHTSQSKYQAQGNVEVEQGQFQQEKMPSFSSVIEDNQEMVAPWDALGPDVVEESGIEQEQSAFTQASAPWDEEPYRRPESAAVVEQSSGPAPTLEQESAQKLAKSHPGYVYIGDEDQELTKDDQETENDVEGGDTREATNDHEDMLLQELAAQGIKLKELVAGSTRRVCPECAGGSTAEKSFILTVRADYLNAVYICHRAKCGFKGAAYARGPKKRLLAGDMSLHQNDEKEMSGGLDVELLPLNQECKDFFAHRGITEDVVLLNRIGMEFRAGKPHIAFPYFRDGKLVNIKYRSLNKEFSQIKGGEKILFGYDDVRDQKDIIIVEGEMDKLALNVAGFWNVVSVPDGAPSKASSERSLPPVEKDRKYSYLWNCRDVLYDAEKITFAVDNDDPGDALQTELSRRIGVYRCWTVNWPLSYEDSLVQMDCDEETQQNDAVWFRKDANQVLMQDGVDILQQYVKNAKAYPVVGLQRFVDHAQELADYYNYGLQEHTSMSTGWPSLDPYYKIVPGELSIVTGIPNSGKSEFLDALAVNLASSTDCAIAFCSMEKNMREHGRQLMEKYIGKPFFSGLSYTQGKARMNKDELRSAIIWIDAHFPTIISQTDTLPDIDWVLEMARLSIFRHGIKGLVIDPYNELDHQRPRQMSETEYVSQMLAKVKRFAQTYNVHVWFVAHPRQMHQYQGEPPNLYDISGSAHFINKADCGIVVHRNWKQFSREEKEEGTEEDVDLYSDEDPQLVVRILVRKMRNKTAGTVGECVLVYDPTTGRYRDPLIRQAE